MGLTLDSKNLTGFVEMSHIMEIREDVEKAHRDLEEKSGEGAEFTGWTDLPSRIDNALIEELEQLGKETRERSEAIVSIGIGGSYLGIRATEVAVGGGEIPIYYAGLNISSDYHARLLEDITRKDVTVVVISKSGTTTEPALAFRMIREALAKKYSPEEMKKRVICVTDGSKGALRRIADEQGYRSYVIPDDVGGRFSILTPVGLVPLALAGIDIRALVEGAREGQKQFSVSDLNDNLSYQYAAARYLLFTKHHRNIEVTSSFYENLQYVTEWWKQLFGESEAKEGKGIFPASLMLSTDLHSMGQLMQEGERNVFETFIRIEETTHQLPVPSDEQNLDNFNCVAGKDMDFVNKQAYVATSEAHYEGGVPNMTISLTKADAFHIGLLYYFYERAVAVSGYLLGVNPFNQPGVEAYKKKMFALLGRT